MRLARALRRSLSAQLLAAQLAVIVAGAATLTAVAYAVGPTLFHRHLRDALGIVPPGVSHHLDEAFTQSLALSLGVGVGAAALTAALVSWILAARIVRPVRTLASAARRVSRGDYTTHVHAAGADELTVLARAFNEMAGSLDSAEQRRRRLLADLAHELRNPLATIDAYLEGLADGVVQPTAETWRLLRAEAGRLDRLTDDLAKVSRAEERQLDLRLRNVAARDLLAAAVGAAASAYADKGVRLEVDAAGAQATVEVDPDRFAEVLANLLENSLRHTPPGGAVSLSTARAGEDVLITVSDTGEGIEPDDLDRIFERFYRGDEARSRDSGGSGIGLTITRALVEAHDGRISAESSGPGTGATFQITLPVAFTARARG